MFNSVFRAVHFNYPMEKRNINVRHQTDALPGQCLCKKMKNEGKEKKTCAAEPGTG